MQEEAVGYRLATFHNLYYLQKLMNQVRESIKKGKFKEFKTKIEKLYKKADSDIRLDKPKKKKSKLEKYNESKNKINNSAE